MMSDPGLEPGKQKQPPETFWGQVGESIQNILDNTITSMVNFLKVKYLVSQIICTGVNIGQCPCSQTIQAEGYRDEIHNVCNYLSKNPEER